MDKDAIQNIDYLLWNISENDDIAAYRSLFEQYYVSLCQYARRYIDDKATREDIVQDVFFAIWEKRKTISPTTSAKNYLITCVKNFSLNHLRKQGYQQEYEANATENIPPYFENGDSLYTLRELYMLLENALDKLPVEYRIAFEMSRFEDKSTSEIAEIMGVSNRTVERYRNKAIEILKEELKDYLPIFMLFTRFFN